MGKAIIVCSAKGGTGKTTTSINLAVALADLGKRVALVDGSITTPDVGLHLMIPFYVRSLNEVVEEKAMIEEATFTHTSGLKIIPSSIHMDKSLKKLDAAKLNEILDQLKQENDFVIVDSAAGLDFTALGVIHAADELLVVVNPEISALINAYKSVLVGKKQGVKIAGLIINKHGKFKDELKESDMFSVFGKEIELLGKVPEDVVVQMGQRKSEPVVSFSPKSKASIEFKKIAAVLAGRTPPKMGFFQKVLNLFR